jgi:hypothetical protein
LLAIVFPPYTFPIDILVLSLNSLDELGLDHPHMVVTQTEALDVAIFLKESAAFGSKSTFFGHTTAIYGCPSG